MGASWRLAGFWDRIGGWTVRVQKSRLDLNLRLDRGRSTGTSRTQSWAWFVAYRAQDRRHLDVGA
jgi:hypothetical protein